MTEEHSGLVAHKFAKEDDGKYLVKREAKKTNDSTFDRIYKYYHSPKARVELTELENNIRRRWEKAWFFRCRYRTKKQVVNVLCKLFNIEKSVAYDDVNKATMLFTDPVADSKAAKRAIAESALLQGAHKAWVKGDLEMHHKYMKEYAEINGLKNESDEHSVADLVKNLKPHQIIIVSSQAELESQANAIQEEVTRDIEHEELNG